jgi:hypothetical protein
MPKQPKASAEPALIVFGFNQPIGSAQAAWFRAAHVKKVYTVAQRIGFSSIAVDSDERRELAAKLEAGQLLSGGKLLLPAIADELYQQLLGFVADQVIAAEADASTAEEPGPTPSADSEAPPQSPTEMHAAAPVTAAAWSTLTAGTRVLALYLDKRGNPEGWWEAEIVHVKGGRFFITWCDEPNSGVVIRDREQIALMLPTT